MSWCIMRNLDSTWKHHSHYKMLQVCCHGAATATISSPGTTTCRLLFGYGIYAALSLPLCLCRKIQSVLQHGTLPAHALFYARSALTCTCGHHPVPVVSTSPCSTSELLIWSGTQMGAVSSWRSANLSAVPQSYLPCLRKNLINLMILPKMNEWYHGMSSRA